MLLLDVALVRKRLLKLYFSFVFHILYESAEQYKILLDDMDILRFPIHMFINLFANIRNDQGNIALTGNKKSPTEITPSGPFFILGNIVIV